jgi:hypothetical protein
VSTIRQKLSAFLGKGNDRPSCDTCAFVEFFRSNGDGQVTRIHAFCRREDGPYQDRPVPRERRCEDWQRSEHPPVKPAVGDPTLTV